MAYGSISAKQQEILNYIKSEIINRGYPPAVRDICEAVHLKSTSSVHAHLEPATRLAGVDTYTCPFSQRNCILFIDLVLIEDMSDLSTNSLAMVGCVSMR